MNGGTLAQLASVAVAAIAALAAIASQRAAARASVLNTTDTNRTDLEREAYMRARRFDMDTIERQDTELQQLQTDNARLRERVTELERELAVVKGALALIHPDE